MGITRLVVAATLAGALAGTAAPSYSHTASERSGTARAVLTGSIVFLKDDNVWIVNPDGSGLAQVTRDGTHQSPYYSPSMSDDGILAAGKDQNLVRMRQNGTVLNTIDPPALTNSAGQPQDGVPVHVAISPDGTRIAWSTALSSCPVGASCGTRQVTGVTGATQLTTPVATSTFGDPSWVTNTRLMVHGGFLSQMMLQDVGGSAQHWFDDQDYAASSTDLGDGSLSRDGRFLVAVRGFDTSTHLMTYQVSGDPRTGEPASVPTPSPDCVTSTDARLASPTVSPDGRAFAFQDSDGLTVMQVGATCEGYVSATIVPGASHPFWSPAANNPGPVDNGPRSTSFDLRKAPSVSGRAVVGHRLEVTAGQWQPGPDRTTYQWLRNGKAIRGARSSAYRVTRGDRGKRLSVSVTAHGAGIPDRTVTIKVGRVRR